MIVSHKHRFVYFAPQKTGTTTMASLLFHHFGATDYGSPERNWPRHHVFLPKAFEDYFTFVSVRNPFDRFISGLRFWPEMTVETLTWMNPITYQIARPMCSDEECVPVRIDSIIRLETLERDVNNLPFVKDHIKVKRMNRSKDRDLSFEERDILWIRDKYQADFQMFGYSPEFKMSTINKKVPML